MAADGPVAALTRAALRDHVDTLDDDDAYADPDDAYAYAYTVTQPDAAATAAAPPTAATTATNAHRGQQTHLLRPHRLHPQSSQVPSQVRSNAHRYYAATAAAGGASVLAPRSHARWGVTGVSTVGRTPAERAESMRTRWDLEWHRGMIELHRLGLSDALSMPDLVATPLGIETNELERAYGERADEALVHPWRPANFARYMQEVCCSFHLLRGGVAGTSNSKNPITGVAQSEWRDRLAHFEHLLPRIRALPIVAWNQAEFDAGQEKWRSARRWDEDTELDLGDDASMTSAQASAWMRFQGTCEETHLVDPRTTFEGLKERLAWAKTVPRQCDDVPSSVDAAVGPLLQAHRSAAASAVRSSQQEDADGGAGDVDGGHYNYDYNNNNTQDDAATAQVAGGDLIDLHKEDSNSTPKPTQGNLFGGGGGEHFHGSVSSLARSVDIPTRRSDIIDDVFGPHPDDHHTPMPPRPGDAAFLPHLADGIITTDPRTHSRKVTTIAPAHRVVDSFTEVSAYLASATYVASLCGPPLRDMAYGVIIVPAGEEALLLGNWRSFADDADDEAARALKHDVLEKSRAVREDERRRERRMNREAREEARARMDEDKAEAERLATLKKKALQERRPTTPSSKRNSYVGPSPAAMLSSPEETPPLVRTNTITDRKARDRERTRMMMAADRDAMASKRSSMHAPEIQSPLKHSTTVDPPTPPRSIRKSTISVEDAPNNNNTTKPSGNRLSGEPRPSLSLFPRRNDSERDGARSPLVLNPTSHPAPQSPIPPQMSGAPRRPSVLDHHSHDNSHARRHSSHGDRDGDRDRDGGERQQRERDRDRGRKSQRDSDGVLFIRGDRSPRRRHLSRTGTVPVGVGSSSISSEAGGFRSRIKRLKGRMGLM
jgi:hypothetical protein